MIVPSSVRVFNTTTTPDEVLSSIVRAVEETGVVVVESSAIPNGTDTDVSIRWASGTDDLHSEVLVAVGQAIWNAANLAA